MSAFEKFLLFLSRAEAVEHVIHCLTNGSRDNEAWTLMAKFNGDDWECPPIKLPHLVLMTIVRLAERAQESSG